MHLMMKFEAVRDRQKEVEERMDLVFMDTESGKVVELGFDAFNVLMNEREPSWAEMDAATKTLGKPPVGMVSRSEVDELQKKLEAAQRVAKKLQEDFAGREMAIQDRDRQILKLQNDKIKDEDNIIANALDTYIEELAAIQDFPRYEAAKKIFRKITGRKWVEDGVDDDEEGDLSD